MNFKFAIVIFISLLNLAFVNAQEQDSTNIAGVWKGMSEGRMGPTGLTYDFNVDGSVLTGTMEGTMGKRQITDGKIDGDSFSFNVNLNGEIIRHEGTIVSPDELRIKSREFHVILHRPKSKKKKQK